MKQQLTILTPTYNRGKELSRLYKSLCDQTNHAFVWIIIDDGSNDDTGVIVDGFLRQENPFVIKYIYKPNGGKHTALNCAHAFLDSDYVTVVDSDDFLTSDAVEAILSATIKYKDTNPSIFIFQRGKSTDPNTQFDKSHLGGDVVSDLYKLVNGGMHGDHCEVARTDAFCKYAFPVFDGETFIGESWLWQQIGFDGKCVFINKIIYICEYLEGGLTKSGRRMRVNNPLGGMEHARIFLSPLYAFRIRFKNSILFISYGRIARIPFSTLFQKSGKKLILFLALVPGIILARRWSKEFLSR